MSWQFSGRIAVAMWALVAWAGVAHAQETINYATLSGRVLDPGGAVIAGAQVTARQTDTNMTASASSGPDGRFRFAFLRIGPYEVVVRQSGFADATARLTLTVGAAFDLPITLKVGDLSDSVTVEGETTVIEAARSQIATTIAEGEIRNLPMNGRSFLNLALLVPGVSPTNVGGAQLFPETSAIAGVTLSVNSQRNLSNNFIVDGVSANDDAAALSGIPYGVDAVEQFQVVTSGGQAEFGRALGGFVNVVTRSGTNALHGNSYGYFRDDSLNAKNALSGTKLPMTQKQYGGSLGGPILKDRMFYFVNAEQRRLDQSGLVTILPENVPAINARLTSTGYPGSLIATGVYPNPIHSTNVLAKIDHQFNGRDQLSVRYSLYDVSSENARGAGALSAFTASSALDNLDHSLAVGNTWTLSSRTVNETRVQVAHGGLKAPPTDPIGPAVAITGVATFGTLSSSPTARANTMVQVVDSVSHQRAGHAFRAGVDFLYNDDTITFPRSARGAYTFSSLANFLAGLYTSTGFTQTFGVTEVDQTNSNIGLYFQDEWKAGAGLTLNLGLRYDLQFLQTIHTDANNVSPRAGFVWAPFADRRTLVRGSAGLFFDRIPLRAVANALLSAGNTSDLANLRQQNVTLAPTQAGAPVFPSVLPAVAPSVTLVNLTTMDRDIQQARSRQGSVEVERQLGRRATVSVGYQYLRGLDLVMSINQNVPTCVVVGTNNGCRPDSAYANNARYSAAADSTYHGLHVSFVQRPVSWGNYRVSYTYSKSMNNVGEAFFSSPIDNFDLSKDWGRSDDDQRHRLVVYGSVNSSMAPATGTWQRIVNGFQMSGTVQTYSALPFNITSGVNTIQGTAGRPIVDGAFIPRNIGIGNDFFSLNLRLSRSFPTGGQTHVEAIAEAFNVTNRVNPITRNTNFGAGSYPDSPLPTFNQITAVGEPRAFQFGVRLRF